MRQVDVAGRSGVSQTTVSRIERGDLADCSVSTVQAVAAASGAEWDPAVRWRGGEIDRLLDEDHAALVATTCRLLGSRGWITQTEITFSVYGERGSIDVLAWHAATRTALVVEVKTAIMSVEETLRRHDVKVRLAPRVLAERDGRHPERCARVLVLPDTTTARRRVARHAGVFDRAYPLRGAVARRWLRIPVGAPSALLFLSSSTGVTAKRGSPAPRRVRLPGDRTPTDPRAPPRRPAGG